MKKALILGSVALLLTACKPAETVTWEEPKPASNYSTVSLELMDRSVGPHEDFFAFCNGTWVKNTQIPPTESRWGSFNELEKSNNEKLTAILENFAANPGEKGSMEQQLGAYYQAFINMKRRDSMGIAPVLPLLKEISSINRKDFIVQRIAEQHREGIGSSFSFGIGQDLKNNEINITYMGQGGLGLPNRDYYFKENKKDLLEAYQIHVAKCFEMVGHTALDAGKMAANVVGLEIKLADSMLTPAQQRIPELTYNKLSFKEVSELLGTLDFRYYLSILGASTPDSIVVSHPPFLTRFAGLLESEPLTVWKDYLQWKTLNHYAGSLNQAMVDLNFNFYGKTLRGKKEQKPLNEQAIDEITNLEIGELLGKAFVEKHFSEEAQQRVNTMVDHLLVVFRKRIQALEWMSATTKVQAERKLDAIGRKLGFPNQWEDYSSIDLKANDYLANVRAMALYSTQKNLAELKKTVDKNKWGMPAHMVNAYYHPLLNEIAFPAGIMQPPFFDMGAEDAVNYGRIGMVIGHEFTHGFDDMGSKFAADGSFTNWWTEEDRKAFEQRTSLLGETFAGFCPMEGNCVNAELTMGENIADLGGLTMAYYAYTLTDEYRRNEIREGITPAQRFFIAYGQLWKIKYTDAEMKNRLATDPHSPGMYRVNGPLKNCPEFFEAFKIPEGKSMRNGKGKLAKIW